MTFLDGALVSFLPTPLIPVPNVIVFQFNPESMTHTWTQVEPTSPGDGHQPATPMAVRGQPGESFSFTVVMDALYSIADGGASGALAEVSGLYSRVAALEMLMYPASAAGGGLLGTVTAALGSALGLAGGAASKPPRTVPVDTMPVVLFVWGLGRIVPVRVTSLTLTEKLYDELLNPTHVEAQLGLRVLTTDELTNASDVLTSLAKTAAEYTFTLRQGFAVANLVNSVESIVGMLPL